MRKGLFVAVLLLAGCAGLGRERVVKRQAWDNKINGDSVAVVGAGGQLLLQISADGRSWNWHSSPEEVVEVLVKHLMLAQQNAAAARVDRTTFEELNAKISKLEKDLKRNRRPHK